MTYAEARKQLKKQGAAHATGDAYRACMALSIAGVHGGNIKKYYKYLCSAAGSDEEIRNAGLELLCDRAKAWDALLTA